MGVYGHSTDEGKQCTPVVAHECTDHWAIYPHGWGELHWDRCFMLNWSRYAGFAISNGAVGFHRPRPVAPSGGALEIREAQRLAGASKITKGFNTSDVPLEFMLLHGEIAESFQAWRRAQPDLGEELADVALYLFALAEMNGVAEFDLSVAEGAGTAPLSNSVSAERIVAELHPPGLHGGDSRQRSLLSPRTRLGGAVSSSTGS